jgi:hypothetical protein
MEDFFGISKLDISFLEPDAAPAADAPPLATAKEANKYLKSTPGVPLSPQQLHAKRVRAYLVTTCQVRAVWWCVVVVTWCAMLGVALGGVGDRGQHRGRVCDRPVCALLPLLPHQAAGGLRACVACCRCVFNACTQLVALLTLSLTVLPIAWCVFSLALAVVVKQLVIGKYRAGIYPVYGQYHFRHWIVGSVTKLVRVCVHVRSM